MDCPGWWVSGQNACRCWYCRANTELRRETFSLDLEDPLKTPVPEPRSSLVLLVRLPGGPGESLSY